MLDLDEKVFEVREYTRFPVKRYFADPLIKSFKHQDEAMAESIWHNERHTDRRFYAIDNPHEEITLKKKDVEELNAKYGLDYYKPE